MIHTRRRPRHRRALRVEPLESRRLLASDVMLLQNPGNPEDINIDGVVSPADALIAVNQLNQPGRPADSRFLSDVDGDGTYSPRDALLVINRLNSRSAASAISPGERAVNLRAALQSGRLPPHLSRQAAREMLETLERGGRWEVGERFQNGRMINIHQEEADSRNPLGELVEQRREVPPSVDEPLPRASDRAASAITEPNASASLELNAHVLVGSSDEADELIIQERDDRVAPAEHQPPEEIVRQAIARRLRQVAETQRLPEWIDETRVLSVADALESPATWQQVAVDLREVLAEIGALRGRVAESVDQIDLDAIVQQVRARLSTLLDVPTDDHREAGHSERDDIAPMAERRPSTRTDSSRDDRRSRNRPAE